MKEDLNLDDLYWPEYKDFLNETINKYTDNNFSSFRDISTSNLRLFLIFIFKAFLKKKIDSRYLNDIGDALNRYFYHLDPNSSYRFLYPKDIRSVALEIVNYMDELFFIFPEDAPFFIECLEASDNQSEATNKRLLEYFENLEGLRRYEDGIKRGYITKIEEISANNCTTSKYIDSHGRIHTISQEPSGAISTSISL